MPLSKKLAAELDQERARRLGGNLRIESEVGEGTRVELTYQPKPVDRVMEKRWII